MATVGGLRVGNAVALNSTIVNSSGGSTATGTIYTAPSNGYAILTVVEISAAVNANGRTYVTVGGVIVCDTGSVSVSTKKYYGAGVQSIGSTATPGAVPAQIIYLGPGQSIAYSAFNNFSTAATAVVICHGVELING